MSCYIQTGIDASPLGKSGTVKLAKPADKKQKEKTAASTPKKEASKPAAKSSTTSTKVAHILHLLLPQ